MIGGVEAVAFDEALGEAQRHRGVISPLPRLEREGPATVHIVDRLERAGRGELKGRAERISGRKPDERAAISFQQVHRVSPLNIR